MKDMSRITGGNLETSLNLLPSTNCFFTLSSSDHKSRMSGRSMEAMAKRSSPNPKAQPLYPVKPKLANTVSRGMPEPSISIHWPLISASISKLGSV